MKMRFSLMIILGISFPLAAASAKKPIFLDGIKAVFRGSDGTDLVLASELQRPKLDGSPANLDDILQTLALAQEAKKYRMFPLPEEVEKQYEMIAQSNRKTVKELDEMVSAAGFTPDEARKEFAQINAVSSLINFKITGNLIVPESEVIAYYNENPVIEPAAFYIEHVMVPFLKSIPKEQQREQLVSLANSGDPKNILSWEEPFWINETDLAVNKKFIAELEAGQVSLPQPAFGGFEMFRMANKKEERTKSLDDRYAEIVNVLRKPKYTELLTKFQKDLLESASIILFDLPII